MQVEYSENQAVDQKQLAILNAAFEAFAHYGFRRVSMEDIARGAGMSRAALYLHFRNKEDIYRSLIEFFFQMATSAMTKALAAGETPTDALTRAFRTKVAPPFDRLIESPHGPELMDTKSEVGAELVNEGDEALRGVLANWLTRQSDAGQVTLRGQSAQALADTILSGVHGIVEDAKDYPGLLASLDRLADLIGTGLTPT